MNRREVANYISNAALARGIDPNVALRVFNQESGLNPYAKNINAREKSYGVAQLNTQGGLGVEAQRRGIDPTDPSRWKEHVDFSLDTVKKDGWRQWYGARDAGIGRWQGVSAYAPPQPPRPPQPPQPPAPMGTAPGSALTGSRYDDGTPGGYFNPKGGPMALRDGQPALGPDGGILPPDMTPSIDEVPASSTVKQIAKDLGLSKEEEESFKLGLALGGRDPFSGFGGFENGGFGSSGVG